MNAQSPGQIERRDERQYVLLNARCRESSWIIHHVELGDISQGGCCIIGGDEGLEVGQEVRIRFADVKAIPGTVCWLDGSNAGIEFDKKLDSETVERLGNDFSITMSSVADIRSFAKRD